MEVGPHPSIGTYPTSLKYSPHSSSITFSRSSVGRHFTHRVPSSSKGYSTIRGWNKQYIKIGKVGDQIGRLYDYTMNSMKK